MKTVHTHLTQFVFLVYRPTDRPTSKQTEGTEEEFTIVVQNICNQDMCYSQTPRHASVDYCNLST